MIGFIKFLFILFIVVIGLAFHVRNDQLVTLDYYLGSVEVSLSIIVISAMLIGAFLGILTSLGIILPLKREKSRLNKQVKTAEKEVENLRSLPLQDAD